MEAWGNHRRPFRDHRKRVNYITVKAVASCKTFLFAVNISFFLEMPDAKMDVSLMENSRPQILI